MRESYTKDVPRPLINDLWVFLFQKIDVKCVKSVRRAVISAFVKAFTVNVNKGSKPFFLDRKYSPASNSLVYLELVCCTSLRV